MEDDELRKKFELEIEKTEQLILEYQEMSRPVAPDVSIGRISRMDAINNKSITEAALREAQEKLNKLRYVITKIGSPEFGICIKCKTAIPKGRLLIKPESLYCVNCAR